MAHLWKRGPEGWAAQKLVSSPFRLPSRRIPAELAAEEPHAPRGVSTAWLVHAGEGGPGNWALMTRQSAAVRVNGRAPSAGLYVLSDRDEIRMSDGELFFFSTETLPVVEEFSGVGRAMFCARCRQQIEAGSPAVRCPNCGVWHHQTAELPCWTYAAACTYCECETALEASFKWAPSE
jgi:hypothetical protein